MKFWGKNCDIFPCWLRSIDCSPICKSIEIFHFVWSSCFILASRFIIQMWYLHITTSTNESSRAELGKRGFDPSHFKMVPSSSGIGRKARVEIATLPFICCCTYSQTNKNKLNEIVEKKMLLSPNSYQWEPLMADQWNKYMRTQF